jgi:hypothetical protein
MIRIFGRGAEGMAHSQSRKFAERGDQEGALIWTNIGAAIGRARMRPN